MRFAKILALVSSGALVIQAASCTAGDFGISLIPNCGLFSLQDVINCVGNADPIGCLQATINCPLLGGLI